MIQRLSQINRASADKYLLLTGATGFVGRYLLRDLLAAGHRVAVIVRPDRKFDPSQRIEAVMQHWEREAGHSLPRPIIVAGDVRKKLLGLSQQDWNWVRSSCDRVVHAAAVLTFFGERGEEPWLTNVEGTKNVVSLCDQFDVSQFHFLSTAYICGQRDGRIREDELDLGQKFRNDYEHSKFVAERYVRDHCHAKTVTIYRPAVVVGDSNTGATTSYHGLFLYLRLLAMLVPQQQRNALGAHYTRIQLPMQGDEPRNLVPVDWVSQVICCLINKPAAHGETVHLAPEVRTTPRSIVDSCYEYFNSCGVEYGGPDSPADGHESEFARSFFANTKIYQDYDRSDPEFECATIRRYCKHLPCPIVDQGMIHRFLDFGSRDQWGKKRTKPASAAIDVESTLVSIAQRTTVATQGFGREFDLALDVLGPGGGQWTLSRDRAGCWSVVRGILPTATHSMQLNSVELCPIQSRENGSHWFGRVLDAAKFAETSIPIAMNAPK